MKFVWLSRRLALIDPAERAKVFMWRKVGAGKVGPARRVTLPSPSQKVDPAFSPNQLFVSRKRFSTFWKEMYKTLVPQGSPARQVILLPGTAFERLPFDEKPNNSRENSNGTVHPGKNFWQKKLSLSRYYIFLVFTQTTEIFCTVLGLLLRRKVKNGGLFPGGLGCFANGTTRW